MLKSELRDVIFNTLYDFDVDGHEELTELLIKQISCLDDSWYDDESDDDDEDEED